MKFWRDSLVIVGPEFDSTVVTSFNTWKDFWASGTPRIFKDSRRTTVCCWEHPSIGQFVIKTYKERVPVPKWWPFLHGRLKRAWLSGVFLREKGFPVPAHVALVRFCFGQAAIILEKIKGKSLFEVVSDGGANDELFRELGLLIARLHNLGVSHGDLKWVNILLTYNVSSIKDYNIWLVDLDSCRIHRSSIFLDDMARDIARFLFAAFELKLDSHYSDVFIMSYKKHLVYDISMSEKTNFYLKRLKEKRLRIRK